MSQSKNCQFQFLKMENGMSEFLATLCMECWRLISTFHSFQQTILLTQEKLIREGEHLSNIEPQEEVLLKREPEDVPNVNFDIKVEDEYITGYDTPGENQLDHNIPEEHHRQEFAQESISVKMEPNEIKEEYEDPVGVFGEGDINDADDQQSNMSFSDYVDVDMKCSSDDESEHRIAGSNAQGTEDKANKRSQPSGTKSKKIRAVREVDIMINRYKPNLECDICGDKCNRFTYLLKHFRLRHPGIQFRVTCCAREFKERRTFADHVQLHMNPKAFECSHCKKCCTSKPNLAKHILDEHGAISETKSEVVNPDYRHKCPMCDKAYKVPSALREHLCTHTGEFTRVCKYCNKTYKYRSALNYHIRTVHRDIKTEAQQIPADDDKQVVETITN